MQSTVAAVTAELSNRAVILVSDQMLKALDEWRWKNRVSSRGEAIRLMVAEKLGQDDEPLKKDFRRLPRERPPL